MKINQLDLFSGIGGFHLGFERAGYDVTSYFSEIDKHAIAVYKNKFKNSTYVGSVTDVRGADLPKIDLITFGSPCQDFSLAGKRRGMEGERSSLITESIRLIDECRPSVFIWENVKGTFSSNNSEDFWAIIQAFANLGGYRIEWQLLNTSWFIPQNRERIYLVGYSTATTGDWGGIFPITEGAGQDTVLQGHNQRVNTISARYGNDANGAYISEGKQPSQEVKQIGTRLDSNSGTQPYQQDRVYADSGISPTLSQGKSDLIISQEVRVKSATKRGYETATDGDSINLSQPDSKTRRGRVGKHKAQTLETSCNQAVIHGDGNRIRRLTPIECERLQGFPDNHTAFGDYDGETKPMSNTQRYKQCGNAVTVDVVHAVALRCKGLFT